MREYTVKLSTLDIMSFAAAGGMLLFLSIIALVAMSGGTGRVILDFNSFNEGLLEVFFIPLVGAHLIYKTFNSKEDHE